MSYHTYTISHLQRLERLRVCDGHVARPLRVFQEGMLRAHTGVIQPRGDGVRLHHLPVAVLQQVRHRTVKHAGRALSQRRGVLLRGDA